MTFFNTVRFGRLLEDMDIMAGMKQYWFLDRHLLGYEYLVCLCVVCCCIVGDQPILD